MAKVTGRQRDMIIGADKTILWMGRHWLFVIALLLGIYAGLPILAPVLMQAGLEKPADFIYTAYSPMCHQMASRSFFLFGEQYAYPRNLAGTSLTPIEAYWEQIPELAEVPQDPEQWSQFLLPARAFRGNARMGFKMALCERDIAIYGAMLLATILYAVVRLRGRVRPLPWWLFVIVGLGPIALDGFSQLFSMWGAAVDTFSFLNVLFPLRESSPLLRTLTGALFGFTLVWTVFPHVDSSMSQFNHELERKLNRAGVLS